MPRAAAVCHPTSHRSRLAPLAAAAALAATQAWAQNAPAVAAAPSVDEKEARDTLSTVYITANRRKELAKDVAGSVSVLSGGQLEKLGVQTLSDFAGYVPGLQVVGNGGPGNQQQVIRGISTGVVQTSGTVAMYVDDTPVSFNSNFAAGAVLSADPDPLDVERIEVLKGPQGSLYGASAMGGLIKYVTIAPNLTVLEGRGEVGLSQVTGHGRGNVARAAVNIPVMPGVLAVRANAWHRKEGGFIDNAASGQRDVNSSTTDGARVSALFKPSAQFNARLTVETQKIDTADATYTQVDPATLQPTVGDLKMAWVLPMPFSTKTSRTNLTLNYDAGFASLLSSTSLFSGKSKISYDYSNLLGPSFGALNGGSVVGINSAYDNKKLTQEFRLTSPANDKFSWLAGLFYTTEKSPAQSAVSVFNGPAGGPFTLAAKDVLTVDLDPKLTETAAYANAEVGLASGFDLQFGFRYSRIQQRYVQTNFTQTLAGAGIVGLRLPDVDETANENKFTWMVSPRWKLDTDTMAYLRVATGYRPGGPNARFVTTVPTTFKSDSLISGEIGLKGNFRPARLDYNVALYRINWKDIQAAGSDATSGFTFYANGGKAHSQGLELEAGWRPANDWRLSANLATMDAKLDEDIPIANINAKKGNTLPFSPKISAALTVDRNFEVLDGWSGSAGLSYRHVGARRAYFEDATVGLAAFGAVSKAAELPAYDTVDLRMSASKDIWTLSLGVKNLFDKRGATSLAGFLAGADLARPGGVTPVGMSVSQPRTVSMSLRADF